MNFATIKELDEFCRLHNTSIKIINRQMFTFSKDNYYLGKGITFTALAEQEPKDLWEYLEIEKAD